MRQDPSPGVHCLVESGQHQRAWQASAETPRYWALGIVANLQAESGPRQDSCSLFALTGALRRAWQTSVRMVPTCETRVVHCLLRAQLAIWLTRIVRGSLKASAQGKGQRSRKRLRFRAIPVLRQSIQLRKSTVPLPGGGSK